MRVALLQPCLYLSAASVHLVEPPHVNPCFAFGQLQVLGASTAGECATLPHNGRGVRHAQLLQGAAWPNGSPLRATVSEGH